MKSILEKAALLETLKKNRDGHRQEFLKAQEQFRKFVIEELDNRLADTRNGKKIDLIIRLPEPQDHTKDYDRVISMVERTTEQEIQLDEDEFEQFVLDEWRWSASVKLLNNTYASGSKPSM